jgi:hypothetical protein
MIIQPGIYYDITPADYFADPCPEPSATQSVLKVLLDQSPAHARCEHPTPGPGWRGLQRRWARPAIIHAQQKIAA